MIRLSDSAIKHFEDLLKDRESGTNIRIFVERPGTESAECGIAFCPPSLYDMADLIYDMGSFKLVIDPLSDPYLSDAEVGTNLKGGLTLKSPSITKNMLDCSIPLIDRIKFVIATQVNPGIATHGGAVEIVDFLENNLLQVRFHGGCVGCVSVGATIADSLQGKLNHYFRDENITIEDVTDHKITDDTFEC